MFVAELLKLPFCLAMAGWTCGGVDGLVKLLRAELLGNRTETLKCAVPAVAFTVQGNLLFVALANLEAPSAASLTGSFECSNCPIG